MSGKAKKLEYMNRLVALLEEYDRFFLGITDFISSSHMQEIRQSIRGRGVILMGKNTLMRKAIRMHLEEHPEWEVILPQIKGNVGMIFSKEALKDIKPTLVASRVPAAAKAGVIAPADVSIPPQVTTLDPQKTSFFASLDIATKITRGSVEILNPVILCRKGEKVGSSQAVLLQLLGIKPFTYGLELTSVYDQGDCYPASFLDKTESDLFQSFAVGVGQVAALSLGISYPTLAAFPHAVMEAFKNCVAISLGTDYVFEQAEKLKEMVENPEAFAGPAVEETKETEAEPEPEEEEESEDEGFEDLFDF